MPIKLQKPVAVMLFLIAAMTVYLSMAVLASAHWHGPWRDMWEIYPFLVKVVEGSWAFTDLLDVYGGSHRLLIPKLTYIADYQFSGANNHFLIAISIVCQLLMCWLIWLVSGRAVGPTLPERLSIVFLAVFFQFSATLMFNFMHTFDVQWFLCCSFIVTAFYLLIFLRQENSLLIGGLSGLFVVAAALCNFSGMVAWPVWLVLVLKKPGSHILRVALLVSALLFIVLLSAGVSSQFVSPQNAFDWLRLLFYLLLMFPLTYLSSPLSSTMFFNMPITGCLMAFLFLLLAARFWWMYLIRNKPAEPANLFFACLMLFSYGVALATAIGRGYDPSHAEAMRYQNIVMLFWMAAIPFVLLEIRSWTKPLMQHGAQVLCLLVVLVYVVSQPSSLNHALKTGRNAELSHVGLVLGLTNEIEVIFSTVSRFMLNVPSYNLNRERALHLKDGLGQFHSPYGYFYLNGINSEAVPAQCPDLRVHYRGDTELYSRLVIKPKGEGGRTDEYDGFLLVDASGQVQGIAISVLPVEIVDFLLDNSPIAFRGFSTFSPKLNPSERPVVGIAGLSGNNVTCFSSIN